MENIETLRVYNLLDANGNKLLLRLGYTVDERGRPSNGNAGWRWSFEGKYIPMPVRSRTWFCGFPEHTMISWLKGNGWRMRACVDMQSGKADVYDLQEAKEKRFDSTTERSIKLAIKLLFNNGYMTNAIYLYRHLYGCSLDDANYAVKGIID